jgi:hypothetical protein
MRSKEAIIRTANALQQAMADYANEPNGSEACNALMILSGAVDALMWVVCEKSPFPEGESIQQFIEAAYKNSAAGSN